MNIEEFLQEIIRVFKKAGIECAEAEARQLACHVLSCDLSYLILHSREEIDDKVLLASAALINERCKGRPLQYVMGTASFYGIDLAVDERVLIPRPETELLAERAIAELKERHPDKFIWVELGLQTADDQTAAFVRRGYPTALYDACAAELIRAGIPVITHVILGLPGESEEEMLETVRHVNGVYERASGENGHILSGCGIKLQLLHYLAGTELGRRYLVFHKESVRKDLAGELKARSLARDGEPVRKDLAGELKTCSLNWNGEPGLTDEPPAAGHAAGNVTDGDRALRAMTEEEYVRTVADCISVLHPDIVVHRLTGDGNSRILLAPLWSRNKRHVLNSIRHELSSRGIVQGCGRS